MAWPVNTSRRALNLSVHSTAHVANVMAELDTRPRKSQGYYTPATRFRAEVRSPHLLPTSTLTGMIQQVGRWQQTVAEAILKA